MSRTRIYSQVQPVENLNEAQINSNVIRQAVQNDHSTSVIAQGHAEVYFKNLEQHLIDHIENADIVVGCVAWLTSVPILQALARKKGVSVVVQKEDFLRPDVGVLSTWKYDLQDLYKALPPMSRYDFDNVIGALCYCGDCTLDAVRCVGHNNRERKAAAPRAHHKFVVFAMMREGSIAPYAVWTGSFNFTRNANNSFENAVVLTDPEIVQAYYHEHAQIVALSEGLDWDSEWCAPDWGIGS